MLEELEGLRSLKTNNQQGYIRLHFFPELNFKPLIQMYSSRMKPQMANNIPLMFMLTDAAESIHLLSSSATFPFLYDLIFTAVLEHLDFFLDRDCLCRYRKCF